jgi:hypothetical protein
MSLQRTRAADRGFDTTSRSPPRKTERTVTFEILQAAILSMIEDINLAIGADDDGDDAGDQVERWKLYDTLPIKDQIAAAKTRFNFIDAELVGLKSRIVDGRMFLYDDVEWVVTQRRSDIRGSLLATSGQMPTALAGRTFHEVRERLHEIIDHLAASLPAYSADDFRTRDIVRIDAAIIDDEHSHSARKDS